MEEDEDREATGCEGNFSIRIQETYFSVLIVHELSV